MSDRRARVLATGSSRDCGREKVDHRRALAGRNVLSRAFTLIELLVVMAIIATLLSIAAPRYFDHLDRAREATLRQSLEVMRDAIDKYHADTGKWPENIEALVSKRYLRKVPVDPMTGSGETWLLVEPPSGDDGGGVWDVHSGSEDTAKDGTRYAEW